MKKLFVLLTTFLIAASTIAVEKPDAKEIAIENLVVNGYSIPVDDNKRKLGIRMPYDTEQIYVEAAINTDSKNNIEIRGTGILKFTEDKQIYEIVLLTGEVEKKYELVVIRDETPPPMETIKNRIISFLQRFELVFIVVPSVVIFLMVVIPGQKKETSK